MRAALLLATARWRQRPGALLLLAAALALAVAVPVGTNQAVQREVDSLRKQTQDIPLVAGSGNAGQTDLVLSALDFDPRTLPTSTWSIVEAAREDVPNRTLPFHLGHRVQGQTLVGTESEVLQTLGLSLSSGRWCIRPGEVVVGAAISAEDFPMGQVVASEAPKKFALQSPPTQNLRIVGRCAPSGSAADQVVWTNLTTSWVLDGFFHEHESVTENDIDQSTQARNILSPNTPLVRDLYDRDPNKLHAHIETSQLPIHLIRIAPENQRALSLVRANLNYAFGSTTAIPESVADELAESFAARARLIQLAVIIPSIGVSLLGLLVIVLDWQRRKVEHAGLRRLGADRKMLGLSFALELSGVLAIATSLTLVLAWLLSLSAARWVI